MNKKIARQIATWMNTYIEENNLNCFVVGVSGGVDSALTSTLCAMTGQKTYVVNIPINSKDKNTNLSQVHCEWLCKNYSNVEQMYLDASEPYNHFQNLLNEKEIFSSLANANSKSRMRMMILYYIATSNCGLVVGTGNKVEDFGVGFFTKYGDGGVDISPIADLTKTQVKSMAKSLNIDPKILNAPPTDGLWEDSRTDESQIGATYDELEWAMEHTEGTTERQKEVLSIYTSLNKKNRHKMNPIPVYKLEK